MTHTELHQHIQNAIRHDKIGQAFNLLEQHLNRSTDTFDHYLIQSGRWREVSRQDLNRTSSQASLAEEKNRIRLGLLEIGKELTPADLQEAVHSKDPLTALPILVICKDETDKHYMRDLFSRLDFQEVEIKVIDTFAPPNPAVRILVFANHSLGKNDEKGKIQYDETDQTRFALMEQYLRHLQSEKRFTFVLHFGEFWQGLGNWREWAHAANSRFALYARLRELAAYSLTYRGTGDYRE